MKVVVYSQPGCGPCIGVKNWLKNHGIEFAEKNIRTDEVARGELSALGAQSTPVVTVGDDVVIIGYVESELARVLL